MTMRIALAALSAVVLATAATPASANLKIRATGQVAMRLWLWVGLALWRHRPVEA